MWLIQTTWYTDTDIPKTGVGATTRNSTSGLHSNSRSSLPSFFYLTTYSQQESEINTCFAEYEREVIKQEPRVAVQMLLHTFWTHSTFCPPSWAGGSRSMNHSRYGNVAHQCWLEKKFGKLRGGLHGVQDRGRISIVKWEGACNRRMPDSKGPSHS